MGQHLTLRRGLRGRRRGDAIVEFALIAPMMLVVLLGILEVGRLVDAWLVVQNAAREGARVGASATYGSDVSSVSRQAALTYLSSGLAPRSDVAGTAVTIASLTSDTVAVTAEADILLYTPLFQAMLPSPVPVRATAAMRRQ